MIGTVLSHYRIVEKIGEGGMGEVYRAEDLRLPRSVAIKILPEDALRSSERRERFIREARAASSLNHPGIVHVYDIDEVEGRLFIAMEHVQGRTISQLLEAGELSMEEILRVGVEAGEALAAAHAHGIIHRDVKPSNIIMAKEGFVKILDFGLAKLRGDGSESDAGEVAPDDASTRAPNLTRHGQLIGTVLYMSPELALGEAEVDRRSDVFSFGAVLYEMATRRLPFTGGSEVAILDKILHGSPPSLIEARPDLPEPYIAIVEKAMEKKPENRYQSVEEMVVDLRRLQRQSDVLGLAALRDAWRRPAERRQLAARWGLLGAAAVVTAALAVAALADRGTGWSGTAGREVRSVAVVPFENAGGNPENEYFSAGVTEGILVDLSRIAGIEVLAPPGGRETGSDPIAIARDLGAEIVLQGSVRRQGGQVRVSSSLKQVDNGQVIWADRIDRPQGKVFELQDEVSHRVARALRIRLTRDEEAQIARVPTSNMFAYKLYLQGRMLSRRRGESELRRAVALYRRALEQDPDYALAHAGLANAYSVATMYGWKIGEGTREIALESSERAIALDPTLPEAHVSRGVVAALEGDLAGGVSRLLHALTLAPNLADVHHWLSVLYKLQGRYEEAAQEGANALKIDPDLGVAHLNLAHIDILAGRPERAVERVTAITRAQPDLVLARILLGWAWMRQGETDRAVRALEAASLVAPEDPLVAAMRGLALASAGRRSAARAEAAHAATLLEGHPSSLSDYALAGIHAQTGDTEEAFRYLRRALEVRDESLGTAVSPIYVREDPTLVSLREDPRFEALVSAF